MAHFSLICLPAYKKQGRTVETGGEVASFDPDDHIKSDSYELDIDYLGSGYQFFNADIVRQRIREHTRPAFIVGDLDYDRDLFEKLRALRKKIAAEQGVPPFVVFSDASLAEMAAVRPQDGGGMLGITGVGKHKLEHYGARFLEVLKDSGAGEAGPQTQVRQQ